MSRDSLADPGSPIPDRIPDELLQSYGKDARRTVRRRASRGPGLAERMRGLTGRHRDGEVWIVALTMFGCGIIAMGLVGALIYAVVLMPVVGASVVLAASALLWISYTAATRFVRRERDRRQEVDATH